MSFEQSFRNVQNVSDQLGKEDSPFDFYDTFKEQFLVENLTTRIQSNVIGTSFILGHPTNGVLGTSGVGRLGRDSIKDVKTVRRVVNPFNRFKDYFRGSSFVGTSTTATVDTDNYEITF